MNRTHPGGAVVLSLLLTLGSLGTASAAARPPRPAMLSERSHPPHFSLADSAGRTISLAHFLGRHRIVLLFVPAGQEAQGRTYLEAVERERGQFEDRDMVVLALVEPGEAPAGQAFRPPVWILKDAEGKVAREYGAAADRTTFYLIGKDGHVAMAQAGHPSDRELFGTIDAMPMRRQEMRERGC